MADRGRGPTSYSACVAGVEAPDRLPNEFTIPRWGRMLSIDHFQLAIPPGGEAAARTFFVEVLGMSEEVKPEPLAARGGCWFRAGRVHLHCGVESPFQPQRKAHVALLVRDLDALARRLTDARVPVRWDESVPDRRRFYADDPFGNRMEFVASGCGFSERLQPLVREGEPSTG